LADVSLYDLSNVNDIGKAAIGPPKALGSYAKAAIGPPKALGLS
jgi:hypothetical protein